MKLCRKYETFLNCIPLCLPHRVENPNGDDDDGYGSYRPSTEAIQLVYAFGAGMFLSAFVSMMLLCLMKGKRMEYQPLLGDEDEGLLKDVDRLLVKGTGK